MEGQVQGDKTAIQPTIGLLQPPLRGCDRLGLVHAEHEVPTGQKNVERIHTPLNVGSRTRRTRLHVSCDGMPRLRSRYRLRNSFFEWPNASISVPCSAPQSTAQNAMQRILLKG
jgi:hypothetical protein